MEVSFSCGKGHASRNHETKYDFLIRLLHLILNAILIYALYICSQNRMLHDPNLQECLSFLKYIKIQISFFYRFHENQQAMVIFLTWFHDIKYLPKNNQLKCRDFLLIKLQEQYILEFQWHQKSFIISRFLHGQNQQF